jgi:hypothetical protein
MSMPGFHFAVKDRSTIRWEAPGFYLGDLGFSPLAAVNEGTHNCACIVGRFRTRIHQVSETNSGVESQS